MSRKKWLNNFFCNFYCFIINHDFFVTRSLSLSLEDKTFIAIVNCISLITLFQCDLILFTLFYWAGGEGVKMPYPLGFFKYLQNYFLNWLEIFRVSFSDCLKAVLKKLLKIGVGKALNHSFLGWLHIGKIPETCFFVFSNNFCHFHVVFAIKNHLFWK